ncbi:MAG: DUF1592 domain-containing protein [Myxococcota bacterium]
MAPTTGVNVGDTSLRTHTGAAAGRLRNLWALCFLAGCDGVISPTSVDSAPTEPSTREAPSGEQSDRPLLCSSDGPKVEAGRWRRLTQVEYANSIRDIFNVEADVSGFLDDTTLNNSPFGANVAVSPQGVDIDSYQRVADQVAAAIVPEELLTCDLTGDDCPEQFINSFGRRVFRRPLMTDENEALIELYRLGAESGPDADSATRREEGIRLVVSALLQAPSFLYRAELGDGSGPISPLTDYELATRLSFLLWRTTPDDTLLDAAEAKELRSDDGLLRETRRLLDSPRLNDTLIAFHKTLSGIDRLEQTTREDMEFDSTLKRGLEREADAFLAATIAQDPTIRAILTAPSSYPTPELEPIYGISGDGSLDDRFPERRGLLSTSAFLVASQPLETFFVPTYRGGEIRKLLMCDPIPTPEEDIQFEDFGDVSNRERLRMHTESPTCAICHELMDPIGFALGHFDDLGRYRTEDDEGPIDASGYIVARSERLEFDNAAALGEALASLDIVRDCFATQWFRYAITREPERTDACSLEPVTAAFRTGDGDIREALISLILSDAFRYVRMEDSE